MAYISFNHCDYVDVYIEQGCKASKDGDKGLYHIFQEFLEERKWHLEYIIPFKKQSKSVRYCVYDYKSKAVMKTLCRERRMDFDKFTVKRSDYVRHENGMNELIFDLEDKETKSIRVEAFTDENLFNDFINVHNQYLHYRNMVEDVNECEKKLKQAKERRQRYISAHCDSEAPAPKKQKV